MSTMERLKKVREFLGSIPVTKEGQMRYVIGLACFIIAAAGTSYYLIEEERKKTTPLYETITVEPGRLAIYELGIPSDRIPGRLVGSWTVAGASANVPGAMDDTLIRFRLVGPNNETLQTLEKPTHGNFSIPVNVPGKYTFEFDNRGILRSSKRIIRVEGTLHFGP